MTHNKPPTETYANEKREEIWSMLMEHPDMTAVEIFDLIQSSKPASARVHYDSNTRARFTELVAAGGAVVVGTRECLITGHVARTYRAVPKPWTPIGKKPTGKQELAGRVLAFLKSGEPLEALALCGEALGLTPEKAVEGYAPSSVLARVFELEDALIELRRLRRSTEQQQHAEIGARGRVLEKPELFAQSSRLEQARIIALALVAEKVAAAKASTAPPPPKHSSVFPYAATRPLANLADAPDGLQHTCPTCGCVSVLVENARAHVWRTNHPDPVLLTRSIATAA